MAPHSQPSLVETAMGVINIYSDGSIVRTEDPSLAVPPSEQPLDENGGVASRDIVFDHNLGLWLRLYLPPQPRNDLPVIIYFHGGGFCLHSPASTQSHRLCLKWAAGIGAIIISVGYRLAPEHRLPAAYEDSKAAVEWVRSQSIKKKHGGGDPWFKSHADFSNAYLMGDSSGGNIAHRLGAWAGGKDWEDLRIRGSILLEPFFGGQDLTASETRRPTESATSTLEGTHKLWELALPIGGNRDHPFCNPSGPESPDLADAALPPTLLVIGGHDILCDRHLQYCDALKKCGKEIEVVVVEEEEHAFYALKVDDESSVRIIEYAKNFINRKR